MKRYIGPIYLKRDLLVADILGDDRTLEAIIDDVPTADVREVIHAKWIKKEDSISYWYECSNCGCRPLKSRFGQDVHSSFCPDCGATMDLE